MRSSRNASVGHFTAAHERITVVFIEAPSVMVFDRCRSTSAYSASLHALTLREHDKRHASFAPSKVEMKKGTALYENI